MMAADKSPARPASPGSGGVCAWQEAQLARTAAPLRLPVYARRTPSVNRRGIGTLLLMVATGCLSWVAMAQLDAWQTARAASALLAGEPSVALDERPLVGMPGDPPLDAETEPRAMRPPAAEEGTVLGRVALPRLGIDAPLLEGVAARTLRLGVGRIPNASMPGYPGNLTLAGHRDSYFRSLEGVRVGDVVEVTTLAGDRRFRVQETRVVDPSAVEILDDRSGETLTLITCFPFRFIGPAPKRFVVFASAEPPEV